MIGLVSKRVAAAAMLVSGAALLLATDAPARAAEQWNFYMHQSAPNFAASRGAKRFTEDIEKATGGDATKQYENPDHAHRQPAAAAGIDRPVCVAGAR